MRYELTSRLVVEARIQDGQSHIYARRVSTWTTTVESSLSDAYDSRGFALCARGLRLVQYYDVMVPWYR